MPLAEPAGECSICRFRPRRARGPMLAEPFQQACTASTAHQMRCAPNERIYLVYGITYLASASNSWQVLRARPSLLGKSAVALNASRQDSNGTPGAGLMDHWQFGC